MSSIVSIIIPTYQRDRLISRAIKSCLSQSYKYIEILVVDDGSTDSKNEILKTYQSQFENIKVFTQNNKGSSSARNVGLENATGDYIQFLDSDDIIHPDKILKQVQFLDNSGYDGVYCDYYIDKNGKKYKYKNNFKPGNLFSHIIYGDFVFAIHAPLIKNCNLPKFDEQLEQSEDRDFWLQFFLDQNVKVGYIDESLATYYLHDHNITRDVVRNLNCMIDVLNKYRSMCLDREILLQDAIVYHRGLLGFHLVQSGDFEGGRRNLVQGFATRKLGWRLLFFLCYVASFNRFVFNLLKKLAIYARSFFVKRQI